MHIAALILSLLLALITLGSGVMKLIRAPRIVTAMAAVNVSAPQLPLLGVLEILATIGLVAGIWLPALAIAAAIGSVLYFAGAIIAHLRANDPDRQGAIAFLSLASAALVLLLLST